MRIKPIFSVAAVAAALLGLGAGWWAAQPQAHLSQYDRLGSVIGCQCPTCPKRPIATCGCGFADGMLNELSGLIDGSRSDEEILATFEARYDPSIRIKPAAEGLDLLAWVLPMAFLTVGAVGVGAVLVRWMEVRPDVPTEAPEPTGADADHDDDARAIVERELAELDP